MKKIKIGTIIIFTVLLFVPAVKFNWKENVVSEIDNRMLTNNPFESDEEFEAGEFTEALEDYAQDRIGYRDEMIYLYTVANDKLFGEMVHPSYIYGKDGYVFLLPSRPPEFNDYHIDFIDMIEKIQNYCNERNVPFLFVFDPSKSTILQEELKDGINYNADWVKQFMLELDKRGINYVDNTELLEEKTQDGEVVFNKKFNAGHWNDLGAFYGVNNILERLKVWYPNLHINKESEFDIENKLNTSLLVSEFPIHEYEPIYRSKAELENLTSEYSDDLELNEQFPYFQYIINPERKADGAPKTLVFQGSYMNGMGYKFLENSLGEYIAVHDYENVINFDYYYNIFQPECVIFEVAEYTTNQVFFNQANMQNMKLNPEETDLEQEADIIETKLNTDDISVKRKGNLCNITVNGIDTDVEYAYLKINDVSYDLKKDGDTHAYNVTIEYNNYDENSMELITYQSGIIRKFVVRDEG